MRMPIACSDAAVALCLIPLAVQLPSGWATITNG